MTQQLIHHRVLIWGSEVIFSIRSPVCTTARSSFSCRDFVDLNSVAAIIQRRDHRGSNEVFRRRVEELYPVIKREEIIRRSEIEKCRDCDS